MKIVAETDRFLLREMLPSDIDGMFELDSDPEVHKYLGNNPVSNRAQIVDTINFVRQQYMDYGIGRWAIIDKKTNEFMGWSGLKFVTELTNKHQNYYDLGYRLIRKYWRKGIATETAMIALDYAFNVLNVEAVYAAASIENIGSNKILQRIGLNFIETFFYKDIECNWYMLNKQEYEKKIANS